MRTIELIWVMRPRDLGKPWTLGVDMTFYQVMPDGSRERVQVKVTQERQ